MLLLCRRQECGALEKNTRVGGGARPTRLAREIEAGCHLSCIMATRVLIMIHIQEYNMSMKQHMCARLETCVEDLTSWARHILS